MNKTKEDKKVYSPSGELFVSRARSRKVAPDFPAVFTQEYIGTTDMEKLYGVKAHATIFATIGEDLMTGTDSKSDFDKIGKIIINNFLNKKEWLDELIKWSEKQKDTLRDFIEKKIPSRSVSSMSNKELAERYLEYFQKYRDFHLKNTPVWWIGTVALEEELEKCVQSGEISPENLSILIEDFSNIHELAKEELNLLKIVLKIRELKTVSFDNLPKDIDKLLHKHVKDFSSIPFGYDTGVLWNNKHFLDRIKEILLNRNLVEELKKKINERKVKKQKQDKLFQKLNLGSRLEALIKATQKIGYLQDLKKTFQTKSHPHLQQVVAPEIMKRLDLDIKYFGYITPHEISDGLINGRIDDKLKEEIRLRIGDSILVAYDNKYEWILGSEAVNFAKKHKFVIASKNIKELKGNSASRGKVKGVVKVCSTSKDIAKIKKGDILVASMTTPDYVPAMRIAGAIITDEGGITCHAAIISRELNIPCIIGTKIATKVLNDGDLVEVDADKGVVKIIK